MKKDSFSQTEKARGTQAGNTGTNTTRHGDSGKPKGPITYSQSKGSDVFWPGKNARKAMSGTR